MFTGTWGEKEQLFTHTHTLTIHMPQSLCSTPANDQVEHVLNMYTSSFHPHTPHLNTVIAGATQQQTLAIETHTPHTLLVRRGNIQWTMALATGK